MNILLFNYFEYKYFLNKNMINIIIKNNFFINKMLFIFSLFILEMQ